MTVPSPLDALAAAHGILTSFRDLSGETRSASPETKTALLRANGLALDNDAMVAEALAAHRAQARDRFCPHEIVVERGAASGMAVDGACDWHLTCEDALDTVVAEGAAREGRIDLPPLPSGVHSLTVTRGGKRERVRVIAAPPSCPSVEVMAGKPRIWGATAALYGLRSDRNGGVGGFADLERAARAFGACGADFLGINPVHALGWSDRVTISPYSPSHRGFLDTRYIVTDGGGAVDAGDLIDYAGFGEAHRGRLEALHAQFEAKADGAEHGDFSTFCAITGEPLATFALYEALSETHGDDWREWPAALQRREPGSIAAAEREHADRIRFHQWLQWIADARIAAAQDGACGAGMALGLYLDLAVGPRRGGAESWCEQGATARGVSLGAPPDHLSPGGQNWQLAAYAPTPLAGQDYRPLRRIVAATMRRAGMLRIDHVLGLNRSYWIPDDGSPGGYIRQPFEALLAMVAIEAERAGTVVIGEDLGLVPEGFRETLEERGFYSYSVLQYEKDDAGVFRAPDTLRRNSLLCFGTHDTPTIRGYREGRDVDWWHRLGWIKDAEKATAHEQRGADVATLADGKASGFAAFRDGIHRSMAASPVAMVSIQLDDLCNRVEAQNLPGTIDEHPNWRRRMPVAVEDFDTALDLDAVGAMMKECGRGRDTAGGETP